MKDTEHGFTLIELTIAIAIMGILAAVTRVNFSQRTISKYLNPSHFTDLPRGIDIAATASAVKAPGEYTVVVMVTGDKGTERILDDLEKMFPRTLTHFGTREFVIVDSSTLAVKPKS